MNYHILVNKNNPLSQNYQPPSLITTNSQYKNNILINNQVNQAFILMQQAARRSGYEIDIMSGYRDYNYQEKLYNESLQQRGYTKTFRIIAKPGCSEHQTGLAIDICIYRLGKCYIEHEIEGTEELTWLKNNCHKYGFILRYPKDKEDITGYNYEPWHYRYIGKLAENLTKEQITLEEYYQKSLKKFS